MTETTPELRRRLRTARRDIASATQAEAADQVAARLEQLLATSAPAMAAAYLATDGELSPATMVAQLRRLGTQMAFPRIDNDAMTFHLVDSDADLMEGDWGLMEPGPRAPQVAPENLELVLTPLVGFDARLNRIGRGKAYYDRCFAFLAAEPRPTTPRLIGVAHDVQRVRALTPEPHDIRLDALVTPTNTYGTI